MKRLVLLFNYLMIFSIMSANAQEQAHNNNYARKESLYSKMELSLGLGLASGIFGSLAWFLASDLRHNKIYANYRTASREYSILKKDYNNIVTHHTLGQQELKKLADKALLAKFARNNLVGGLVGFSVLGMSAAVCAYSSYKVADNAIK